MTSNSITSAFNRNEIKMKSIKQNKGKQQAKFDFAMGIDMMVEFDDRCFLPPKHPDPLFDQYLTYNGVSSNPFNDVINDHNGRKIGVKVEERKEDEGKNDSMRSRGESKNDHQDNQEYMHNISKMDGWSNSQDVKRQKEENKEEEGEEENEETRKRQIVENAEEGKHSEGKEMEKNDESERKDGEEKGWRSESKSEEKWEDIEDKYADDKSIYTPSEKQRMEDYEEDNDDDDDGESIERLDGHIISKNIYADIEAVEEFGVEREVCSEEFLISRAAAQSLSA